MKPFFIITKRLIAVAFAVVVIFFMILSSVFSVKNERIDGSTNQKRVEYIKNLGFEVDDADVAFKQTVIPQKFDNVYKQYNSLQKKSGFDLSKYKSKTVTVYTYPLVSGNREAHIIIYNGVVIGGDVAEISADGSMSALK
ncbi:MAG: DUF4830 domain-containing protein [Clostridia bacterium]|nr:DUF4830 domain-containing protein [Clostridia bacterium]